MLTTQKLHAQLKDTYNREKVYIYKMKINGPVGMLNRKWENEKIEQQASELQKAADNNDVKPLWGYQKRLKTTHNHNQNAPLYQKDGTETHGNQQSMKRWTEWAKQQFNKTQQATEDIQIDHISEQTWEKLEKQSKNSEQIINIRPRLQTIRKNSTLQKWQNQRAKITNVLLQDYIQKEVENAIKAQKPQRKWNIWYTSRSIQSNQELDNRTHNAHAK